ncbi:MAG: RNA polymerase [Flavobacteriales bacterium]|nr:MAG: RNA polymerase [Flavobacteriales bacterium]
MKDITDQTCINKILNGEIHLFRILVNRYKNMVYSLTLKIVKNNTEAEEIAMDTFLKAYKNLSAFKGNSKFSTWLYKIAYNSCLDYAKKKKQHHISIDEIQPDRFMETENAFMLLAEKDKKQAIHSCLEKLSPEDNFLLILHYYEDQSLAEIATIMGLKYNYVKVKLHRARKKLMHILNETLSQETLVSYGKKK